jgi:RimJ/RimL family protein N-acetyltransferase
VTLEPLQASHAEGLFPHIGGTEHGWLWDYMLGEPPLTVDELRTYLETFEKSETSILWAIRVHAEKDGSKTDELMGYIGLLNIVPVHRSIEVGHVMYSRALQRTTPATESVFLLARYALRDLGYRRLEWKCNNLNESSKKAALRYGFNYEGVFRQHMIIKGRNRDTAWYSLLDSEWAEGGVEAGFERWLDETNFDAQGKQKRRLEDFVNSN